MLGVRALRHTGRYARVGIRDRNKYTWPNGKKLAVYIGLNVEEFSYHHPGTLGANIGGTPPDAHREPDVLNWGWRDHGNRVGVWRLLDVFGELGVPVAALANTAVYTTAPRIMEALRENRAEVVGHGVTNAERQGAWSEDDERRMIDEATAHITRVEGRAPSGWLGPWISQSPVTLDLLAECGYTYTMDWAIDDQPVLMATRSGKPMVALPYNHEICDIPAILAQKVGARDYGDLIIDAYETMARDCARHDWPLVLSIPLHPFLCGQAHRIGHVRRALEHIVRDGGDDIWFTRPGDIVQHVLSLPDGTLPPPPTPYAPPPLPEAPAAQTKRVVHCDALAKPLEPFSQVVTHNGNVYLSCVQGFVPGTLQLASDDVYEQARQVFANTSTLLASAGASMSNVVKATLMLLDMDDFDAANRAFNEAFPEAPPARTTFQATLPKGCRVTLDVTAFLPS